VPVDDFEPLRVFDQNRAGFARRFQKTSEHEYFCFFSPYVNPVKPGFQDVKRSIIGVDFDRFFFFQGHNGKKDISFPDLDAYQIISRLRQVEKIHFRVLIQSQIFSSAHVNFCSSFSRSHPIAFNNRHIHHALFIVKFGGSLDVDVSVYMAKTCKCVVCVPSLVIGIGSGERENEND